MTSRSLCPSRRITGSAPRSSRTGPLRGGRERSISRDLKEHPRNGWSLLGAQAGTRRAKGSTCPEQVSAESRRQLGARRHLDQVVTLLSLARTAGGSREFGLDDAHRRRRWAPRASASGRRLPEQRSVLRRRCCSSPPGNDQHHHVRRACPGPARRPPAARTRRAAGGRPWLHRACGTWPRIVRHCASFQS